jgi:hypothetical protein
MRSDRSPYFLYKNHKDPKIRELLAQAQHMQVAEIQALTCKPDLKKAMLFVKQFGDQDKSVSTANLIADRMPVIIHTPQLPQGEIYSYDGPTIHLKIRTQGRTQHMWEVHKEVFLHQNGRVWLNHSWCDPTPELWCHSKKLCDGDLNTYNQILHNHVNQKHAARS